MKKTVKICESCAKEFLIIPQEQKFYDVKKLPLPACCHECRRMKRASLRNPRKLYQRVCNKCGVGLQTTYPPDSPYIIYCEQCYYAAVN